MQIINCTIPDRTFCAGSFTKLLTTFVMLEFLRQQYCLSDILDDPVFFGKIATNEASRAFLLGLQAHLGAKFTIRDLCTFYTGMPYTFDVADTEIAEVERGKPFKHHTALDEKGFLQRFYQQVVPVYKPQSKFHYSELSIIFLAYFLEKALGFRIEDLYQNFLLKPLGLENSLFSRVRPSVCFVQDLSMRYDYPSIAVLDHGYFCYSNGFYTTANDMAILLEGLLQHPVFTQYMVDLNHARAASPTIMNGLTVEMRRVGDDILYGYQGLSFSGCNIWAYSTKQRKGYLTTTDDEESAYQIYDLFGYEKFDSVFEHTEVVYKNFRANYRFGNPHIAVPSSFHGKYLRVDINNSKLATVFEVGKDYMVIRNPEMMRYEIVYSAGHYRILGKDGVPGAMVGFVTSSTGSAYFCFDGTLYRKMS